MANFTPNINLEKPLQTENYNVDVFNDNADKIDAEFKRHNDDLNSHNGILYLSSWKKNYNYVVGDVIKTKTYADYKILECIKSGTSGEIEPTWTDVNTKTADGSCEWLIKRISNNVPYYLKTYTENGVYSFVAPITALYKITVVGAGGSGGNTVRVDNVSSAGGSGGAGGYSTKLIKLNKNDVVVVTVGKGGNNLNNGGTSSFGTYISATGGGYGWNSDGTTIIYGTCGFGGIGIGGDINGMGSAGNPVSLLNYKDLNAGGLSGNGGASLLSGGANPANNGNGNNGILGSGGSGADNTSVFGNFTGGNGGDGVIIIEC